MYNQVPAEAAAGTAGDLQDGVEHVADGLEDDDPPAPHYPTRGVLTSSQPDSSPPLRRQGSSRSGKRKFPGKLAVGKRIKQSLTIVDLDDDDDEDSYNPAG